MPSLTTLSAGAVLATFLPLINAHMALYHPSTYGFGEKSGLIHEPLAGQSFNGWWFHGYASDTPAEVMTITAGQPLTVGISCRKTYSEYGATPDADACPMDSGAYHAGGTSFVASGWQGNTEDLLMGCALAISPTPDAKSTRPEDFIIMSIQENCVRQRDTTFQIPANLPECPEGGCTCAWFWQGHNSQDEMYMSGYRCNVENGVASAWPTPAKPKKGAISGPTQPLYWANDAAFNNLDYAPNYDNRPSYNKRFGWSNGAQTSAFGAGGAAAPKPIAGPTKSTTPQPIGAPTKPVTVSNPTTTKGTNGDPQAITPKPPVDAVAPAPGPIDDEGGDTEDDEGQEPTPVPMPVPIETTRRTRPTGGWRGGWRNKNKGNAETQPAAEVVQPAEGDKAAPGGANNFAAVQGGDVKPPAQEEEPCEGGEEAPLDANNFAAVSGGDVKPSAPEEEPCEGDEGAPVDAVNLVAVEAGFAEPSTPEEEPCGGEEEVPADAKNLVAVEAGDAKPTAPVVAAESGKKDNTGEITDDDYEKEDGEIEGGEVEEKSPTPVAGGAAAEQTTGMAGIKPTGSAGGGVAKKPCSGKEKRRRSRLFR